MNGIMFFLKHLDYGLTFPYLEIQFPPKFGLWFAPVTEIIGFF